MKKQTKIILAVLVCIVIALVGYLTFYLARQAAANAVYEQLKASIAAVATPAPTQQPTAQPSKAPVATLTPQPQTTIDFAALHEINPDIYAWISLTNTEIAYPVAQHESDDTYYLDYTIEGVRGYPGSIYTEKCDVQDFGDAITVIYGHNMANGTMFGDLDLYRDASYLEQHRELLIYTATEEIKYTIFAAVAYDDRYIPASYDDTNPEDCEAFLASLHESDNGSTQVLDDVVVDAQSKLLVLSTCIGGKPNNRYVIVAVRNEA